MVYVAKSSLSHIRKIRDYITRHDEDLWYDRHLDASIILRYLAQLAECDYPDFIDNDNLSFLDNWGKYL